MSQRGSFITEYVYCRKCFDQLKMFFIEEEHNGIEKTVQLTNYDGELIPIIAGKTRMGFAGEEKLGSILLSFILIKFEYDYIPELEKRICHGLRITVLGDGSKEKYIFVLKPRKKK